MKKIILFVIAIATISFSCADEKKSINFEQLPQQAQTTIVSYFSKANISAVTIEREFMDTKYEVFFNDGNKVEFNKEGDWKEIDCKYSQVPKEIIPEKINTFLNSNHPQSVIKEIEKEKKNYKIKLDNRLEIKFDKDFNVIGYDD